MNYESRLKKPKQLEAVAIKGFTAASDGELPYRHISNLIQNVVKGQAFGDGAFNDPDYQAAKIVAAFGNSLNSRRIEWAYDPKRTLPLPSILGNILSCILREWRNW